MLAKRLATLKEGNLDALGSALFDAMPMSVGALSAHALRLMGSRPRVALHVYMWLLDNVGRPDERAELDEWLKAHNNACYLAALHGNAEERRKVVDAALPLARENLAICHNAAAILCQLGDAEGALDAVRIGIEAGLDAVAIAHMRDDEDLDLIRRGAGFVALVADGPLKLPSWAAGWTVAAFAQFREDIRTTLPDPDMSRFDEGVVGAMGRSFDVLRLAAQCRDLPVGEGSLRVHRHFHQLLQE